MFRRRRVRGSETESDVRLQVGQCQSMGIPPLSMIAPRPAGRLRLRSRLRGGRGGGRIGGAYTGHRRTRPNRTAPPGAPRPLAAAPPRAERDTMRGSRNELHLRTMPPDQGSITPTSRDARPVLPRASARDASATTGRNQERKARLQLAPAAVRRNGSLTGQYAVVSGVTVPGPCACTTTCACGITQRRRRSYFSFPRPSGT